MSAKFIRFFIISLLFVLSAAGCGQKGPLFLPEDDVQATSTDTPTADDSSADTAVTEETSDTGPETDDE